MRCWGLKCVPQCLSATGRARTGGNAEEPPCLALVTQDSSTFYCTALLMLQKCFLIGPEVTGFIGSTVALAECDTAGRPITLLVVWYSTACSCLTTAKERTASTEATSRQAGQDITGWLTKSKFYAIFTASRHWAPSWARWLHSPPHRRLQNLFWCYLPSAARSP
jgi:hypothetical protein